MPSGPKARRAARRKQQAAEAKLTSNTADEVIGNCIGSTKTGVGAEVCKDAPQLTQQVEENVFDELPSTEVCKDAPQLSQKVEKHVLDVLSSTEPLTLKESDEAVQESELVELLCNELERIMKENGIPDQSSDVGFEIKEKTENEIVVAEVASNAQVSCNVLSEDVIVNDSIQLVSKEEGKISPSLNEGMDGSACVDKPAINGDFFKLLEIVEQIEREVKVLKGLVVMHLGLAETEFRAI